MSNDDDNPGAGPDRLAVVNAGVLRVLAGARVDAEICADVLAAVPDLPAADVAAADAPDFAGGPLADNARAAADELERLALLLSAIADAIDRRQRPPAPAPVRTPPRWN